MTSENTVVPSASNVENSSYNSASMGSKFGASLIDEGVSPDNLRDIDLPDIVPEKASTHVSLPTQRSGVGGGGDPFQGVYNRRSTAPVIKRGKAVADMDQEMYPFNLVAGSRSGNEIVVGRDDRMSPREARLKLNGIYELFGVEAESHEFCYDFVQGLFLAHALNGSSVVGPGRAKFMVAGSEFSYGDVLKFLGGDARRFFRAYADDIARAISKALDGYDPSNYNSVRLVGQIRALSVVRQLVQFPYLIHDSADACVKLSPAELSAVMRSKEVVLAEGPNAVEALQASSSIIHRS